MEKISPQLLQARKILKTLKKPHPQFLNSAFADPYRGCEYGCLYCYGLKEDLLDNGEGPSPFRVGLKTNCAFGLKKELDEQSKDVPPAAGKPSVGIGFACDPYQPIEEQYQLTVRLLEICRDRAIPVHVLTRSSLILRDKQILSELSKSGLATVSVSVLTPDEEIAKIFEPRSPSPEERFNLIRSLRKENITAGAHLMPVLPYITDSEVSVDKIYAELRSCEAMYCVPGLLSLGQPQVRKRMFDLLKEKFPREHDQYQALYDKLGRPALNYCERVQSILEKCAAKYEIPSVMPVEHAEKPATLVVKDAI